MSVWGSIKHAVHHAAHQVAKGTKRAGEVIEGTINQEGDVVIDGEENKPAGSDPSDSKD